MTVGRGVILLQRGEIGPALATLVAAEEELTRLHARRDLVRTRVWIAHAHFRRGDPVSAGAYFQAAAEEATTLNVSALLDLPARWNVDAFAQFPAGPFQHVQVAVLERVRETPCPAQPSLARVPAAPQYRVASFGRARVLNEQGVVVEWGREKARELFFYLLHLGAARSSRVAADLWPDVSPTRAKPLVYSAVYSLRQATDPETLQAAERTYSLKPDVVAYHDAVEFERIYAEIRSERDEERRLGLMEELVALHTGPLLDDLDAEWATELRRTYELRYLDTLESLVAAYAYQGRWDTCLKRALEGLQLDPDCDIFYEAAARAYRSLGKPWSARRLARRRLSVLEKGA
jgi:DNA-binding SARP family transcriptional activator